MGEASVAGELVADRYRLDKRIGEGASGAVFEAEDVRDGARVALKILRADLAADASYRARFDREAAVLREIQHPAVVRLLDAGRLADGRPFLAMPLLDGASLRAVIEERGRLSPEEAWRIARGVAAALGAAHARDIVHRDLKPDNVFLVREGSGEDAVLAPRVLDFGIAKILGPSDVQKLTATGTPMGTPAYMAPEQWWGTGVSPATDAYALGVMLFEMLAGAPPFASEAFAELVQLHMNEPAPSLLARGVAVSPAIEALVAKLLAKEPADRFASMTALVAAGDAAFGVVASPVAERDGAAPDEASPFTGARALSRFFSVHAAILVVGLAGLCLVGFGDVRGAPGHDPIEWLREGGFAAGAILAFVPFAAYAIAEIARARADTGAPSTWAPWIAVAPAFQGAFGAMVAWRTLSTSLPRGTASDLLPFWSKGEHDAGASRFLGFAVSALLFTSLAALPGVSGMTHASATLPGPRGPRPRQAFALAAACALVAGIVFELGSRSSALVFGAGAIVLVARGAIPSLNAVTATRDEIERRAASALALLFASAAASVRIDAERASLWAEAATRADRVRGLLGAASEASLFSTFALPMVAIAVIVDGAAALLLPGRDKLARPGLRALSFLGAIAVAGAMDLAQRARFEDTREDLVHELTSQFSVPGRGGSRFSSFARLDPPSGDALEGQGFGVHRATALQVTRDAIAVDGRGVATLASLDTPEGTARVERDLDAALANATLPRKGGAEVELSVAIDRAVDASVAVKLLAAARGAGVRRAEILLTRGPSPDLPDDAPAELAAATPRDFVGLPIELGDAGVELGAGRPFEEVARELVLAALAAHGTVKLRVVESR